MMHPRALALVFTTLSALATASTVTAQDVDASVVDEGEVGAATDPLQGRPNAANSSACASCSTAGAATEAPPLAIVGGVLVLGAVAGRRRRA